jgi:hypothetical protein
MSVFVRTINPNVKERNSITLTAYFRDSSNAASAPTTAHSNERERRILTVSADKGTDTETRDTFQWYIENIGAFNE